MAQYVLEVFTSFFGNPTAWGIGLAFVFGAVWFAALAPPLTRLGLRVPAVVVGLLLVFVTSAFLTLAAVSFIQVPLQAWAGQALSHFWGQETLLRWILLAGMPQVLLSGLVQEAAKLMPPLVYMRLRRPKDARAALALGAVAGAGFAILEGQWALNMVFASGWTWGTVHMLGFQGLLAFWERFFAIALHIAATSIAVYGLFKGKRWRFYLLAAFLHTTVNYGVLLLRGGYLTAVQTEVYVAVIALATVGIALWLRWRREPLEPAATVTADTEQEAAQPIAQPLEVGLAPGETPSTQVDPGDYQGQDSNAGA